MVTGKIATANPYPRPNTIAILLPSDAIAGSLHQTAIAGKHQIWLFLPL